MLPPIRLRRRCQFGIALIGLFLLCGEKSLLASTLQERIDRILAASGLAKGHASLQIVSLPEGEILYEKNPHLSLNPASNVKLVTAGAALRQLGPDFTFKTEFYSDTLLGPEGRIHHLWIKGFGDPLFVTEELDSVVDRFLAAGLKEIEGKVFVDDTYFDHYHLTTYLSDVNEKIYSIVTGPLSFNFNSIVIKARPGMRLGDKPIIAFDPPTAYVRLQNQALTSARGAADLEAELKGEGDIIALRGNIPRTIREYSFRRGILDPATYTGTVVMEALQRRGVTIRGGLTREAVPSSALLILAHSSPPLRELLKGLGKFSNNFIAEQLLKTLGAVRLGPPGSTSKGLRILRGYLFSLGIRGNSFVLDNGSGLSKLNRLSASQLIRILLDLYQAPWHDDLIASLSIGGVDGTLRSKLRSSTLRGKVFAKTGTLNQVSALSGYLVTERPVAAFSFLWNGSAFSQERVARVQEKILAAVLEVL